MTPATSRLSLAFLLSAQLLCSSCTSLLNDLFSFGRLGSSSSGRTASGSGSSSGGSKPSTSTGSSPSKPTGSTSGSTPVTTGTSGSSTPNDSSTGSSTSTSTSTARPSAGGRPSQPVQLPIPNLMISPVPIAIPIPLPIPLPVGITFPVPDVRPTPVPVSGGGVSQPAPTAPPAGGVPSATPEPRLFEITTVTVTRTQALDYRVEIHGQGFGALESYQFLQTRIGPYAINLIENGIYRQDQAEAQDLAIGDRELRFIWRPAQGGPTASDKFQWSFQPRGVNQLFQTAEIGISLASE